jgi:undecaprenyl-diphosphatase
MITRRSDPIRARATAVAAGALIVFGLLGWFVAVRAPSAFDVELEQAFFGGATPLALLFTASCRWFVLVPLGVLALLLGYFVPTWRARAVFSVVLTIVAWQISDLTKLIFHRSRPDQWLGVHENSFGYPSGHAMFAVVVYFLWAFYVYRSPLPPGARVTGTSLLVFWGCGVIWSRLSLGAHYPTDLAGGMLLGIAFVGAGLAIMPVVLRSPGRRPIIARSRNK